MASRNDVHRFADNPGHSAARDSWNRYGSDVGYRPIRPITAVTDLAGYCAQLAHTLLFYTPAAAYDFASADTSRETMDKVRRFSFDKDLLGEGAANADVVGMQFADGSTLGNANNVKLRFDAKYVRVAADGQL